ncbi:restriction endonuclease subunit S [Holdemanella porci]|uniref:restriction endonuclease subunit S n=1 Tax=Holdemanella porci TaxID=2652276 RepID=UPI002FD7F194
MGKEVKCIEDELPFEIPDSWEWTRLNFIGEWKAGATPSKTNIKFYKDGSSPRLLTKDLNKGMITDIPNKITNLALEKTSVKLNPAGTVLIAMYGATIGKLGVLTFPSTTNQACCACEVIQPFYNMYLFYFLMENKMNFIKQGEGGAQPNISREKIIKTFIPIPPLNEQYRIVERIHKIEPLITKYKKAEEQLYELNSNIKQQLKKSILLYAIEGKLVPQDPNDEPASALLERIRKEKQKLIAEGKIKKDKNESIIYRRDNSYYEQLDKIENCIDEEIPFDIPSNWIWSRFQSATLYITDYVANGSFASLRENVKTYKEKNYALMVKTQDFSNNFKHGLTYTDKTGFDYLQKSRLYGGELMLSNIGASIGKAFIIPCMDIPMTLAPNSIVIKCLNNTLTQYISLYILSPYGQKKLQDFTAGTAMPKFSKTQLRSSLLPIPPIYEQKRMLSKLDLLNQLIETL